MSSLSHSDGFEIGGKRRVSTTGLAWAAIAAVLVWSFFFYSDHGDQPSPTNWLFHSWPALLALGTACLLLQRLPSLQGRVVKKICRLAMLLFYFGAFLFLLRGPRFWAGLRVIGFQDHRTVGVLAIIAGMLWLLLSLRTLFGGFRLPFVRSGGGASIAGTQRPDVPVTRPSVTFASIGGYDAVKEQLRQVIENRLHPNQFGGIVRNGILLHGPQGTGKTALARAAAGQFRLSYIEVSSPSLSNMWVGETEANIRHVFETATKQRPTLLFIDEIDSLGAARNTGISPGAGNSRAYNDVTIQLMQCIDNYRSKPGLIIVGATNALDSLDPALLREGRFDSKIRVDLPDEATRKLILEAQLRDHGAKFALDEFAKRTPGSSAAKLRELVNRAATFAMKERRSVIASDLRRALEESGGQDRPLFKPVSWDEVVLERETLADVRTLIHLLDGKWSEQKHLAVPTGVLLVGPPGTGKSMLARLIATQTRRSFYTITAADVLGGNVGDSVKRLSEVFARAKAQSPSIIFFDEIDGLLPRNNGLQSTHDVQLVEQCRTEISQLEPEHNVFLIGTTNHVDRIDPAILRGGRFSEKIEMRLPGTQNRERLLTKLLSDVKTNVDLPEIVAATDGLSHADIEAVVKAAVRSALGRVLDRPEAALPPLIFEDFERAIRRISGSSLELQ
jgi:transitional endoplasmic reticulum ATPase